MITHIKTMNGLKEELKELINQEGDYENGIYRGIKYRIQRMGHLKHWCGYIFVPDTEPRINKDDLYVHGGITFEDNIEGFNIYGFDCSHSFDIIPKFLFDGTYPDFNSILRKTYKTKEFAINECTDLINQIIFKLD